MSTVLSIIGALLVLMVLVVAHEFGHYYSARKLGFRVDEFAIGMGPVIYSKEKDGTRFAIRALPIGGLCMFHGEDEAVSDPTCFNAMPVWKRMIVVVSGPLMNIMLALVISVGILMGYGEFMPEIVGFTGENTPAETAGIMEGDMILSVDGREIGYYTECIGAISAANSEESEVIVKRGREKVSLVVKDFFDEESGENKLGIYIQPSRLRYGLFEAVGSSASYVMDIMREMIRFLGSIFTQGVNSGDVAGPVGTISLIGQAVRAGFEVVLRLGVLISINLGIMNILPIPALDGGRLVFMIIEALRGKPIPPEKEGMIHAAGLMLLFGLMILLTFTDVRNLLR